VRKPHFCIVALAGFIMAGSPSFAIADPLVITSGTLTVPSIGGFADGTFSIAGETFSLSGILGEGATLVCFPCVPGTLDISWSGNTGVGPAFGTVNGTFYPSFIFESSEIRTSGTVTLPESAPRSFSVMFPFSASGTLSGVARRDGPSLFRFDVTGSGTATMRVGTVIDFGRTLYFTNSLSYTFADSTAPPVPEPTSVVLLGTVLAGAVGRRAWRTRKVRPHG
jgi:hypothetical protein